MGFSLTPAPTRGREQATIVYEGKAAMVQEAAVRALHELGCSDKPEKDAMGRDRARLHSWNLLLTNPQAGLGNPVQRLQHAYFLHRTSATTVLFN